MARIAVLGGTGFAGHEIVREAAGRGHARISYSRRPPSDRVGGVEYVTAWEPREVTRRHRVSDDVPLRDEAGESAIFAADLALAVVDQIEQPRFRRRRFPVAH